MNSAIYRTCVATIRIKNFPIGLHVMYVYFPDTPRSSIYRIRVYLAQSSLNAVRFCTAAECDGCPCWYSRLNLLRTDRPAMKQTPPNSLKVTLLLSGRPEAQSQPLVQQRRRRPGGTNTTNTTNTHPLRPQVQSRPVHQLCPVLHRPRNNQWRIDSHVLHNDVSVNDGPHIRRRSHNIII